MSEILQKVFTIFHACKTEGKCLLSNKNTFVKSANYFNYNAGMKIKLVKF